jgi:hypothetical protein
MPNWTLSQAPLPGAARGGHPVVHVQARPRLVFFPADKISHDTQRGDSEDFWLGTIYVVVGGQTVAHFTACGGPRRGSPDRGHTAGQTPAGNYTLGPRHHHVTKNWPNSCIPWGASIRRAVNGEVEFDDGSGWKPATGDGAPMNMAIIRSNVLARLPVPPPEDIREAARQAFAARPSDPNGPLVTIWRRNDFGIWAFNLRHQGKGTPYYIHTTPEDERDAANGRAFSLAQSHGCIHIRPNDRDTMMEEGYLDAGIHIEVRDYRAKGPP